MGSRDEPRAAEPARRRGARRAREADVRYQHLLARVPRRSAQADPLLPGRCRRTSTARSSATARCPRRGCARCSRACSARRTRPSGSAALVRAAARPAARALRPLVHGLPRRAAAPNEAELDAITRETLPRRRGLPARPAADPRPARLHAGDGARSSPTTSSSIRRAGAGPRHGRASAATTRPTCARASAQSGMDYKGYNIAIHELGHNVEQVFSISKHRPHPARRACPTPAFTEAFAFLFQARDLELLGLAEARRRRPTRCGALDTLLVDATRSPASALLDMAIWHWMYDHPRGDARPSCARRWWRSPATSGTATTRRSSAWRDSVLPGHLLAHHRLGLYTPDYPLGHLITFQIEQHMRAANLGVGDGADVPARAARPERLDAAGGRAARSRARRCWPAPRTRCRG